MFFHSVVLRMTPIVTILVADSPVFSLGPQFLIQNSLQGSKTRSDPVNTLNTQSYFAVTSLRHNDSSASIWKDRHFRFPPLIGHSYPPEAPNKEKKNKTPKFHLVCFICWSMWVLSQRMCSQNTTFITPWPRTMKFDTTW